jgi:2-(1,2-epoxy-1,2-dihydrophenyl)acetyl-CoA isomerase
MMERREWQTIAVERGQGWASVTLNRPEALNALTETMRRELVQALEALNADDEVRAVMLTGAGRAFSVGQDLAEMSLAYQAGPPQLGRLVREQYVPMAEALHNLAKPTVALVHGPAAGGGLSLALACDLRILTAKATLIPAFIKVGLTPDTGATYHLVRQLGLARTLQWVWSGRALAAQEALEWGLAHWVEEDEAKARARAEQVLAELAQGPTRAYVEIRHLLDQASRASWSEALVWETEVQDRLGHSEDHREAVEAFLAKRPPRFRGR